MAGPQRGAPPGRGGCWGGCGSGGCFRGVFFPHGVSKQEAATSKMPACTGYVSTELEQPSLWPPSLLLRGDQPRPLPPPDPAPCVPCLAMCRGGDTSTGTDPRCEPRRCVTSPHPTSTTSASGLAQFNDATDTKDSDRESTPSPLIPPRRGLGRARRSLPPRLAVTPTCHHRVPRADGQAGPHVLGPP